MYLQLAGGGGAYGDPLNRPMELVAEEAKNGIISVKAAEECYGVIVDARTFTLNEDATLSLREKRAGAGE